MPTERDEDYILGTGSLGLLKNHTNGDINDITIEMIAAERDLSSIFEVIY